MKYIATTNFSQGNKNVLNIPGGGMGINRGMVVELDFDLPITKLPKEDYLKYSVFFGQQPMLVPLDSDQGRQIVAEIERAKTPRERRVEEFKTFDRLTLFRMSDKELAEWQSRHADDEPQWRLAEHEWQRRLTEQSIRATVSAARVQAWFGIAAALIGALGGAVLTLLIQRWSQ
jgi:hypothetical protein